MSQNNSVMPDDPFGPIKNPVARTNPPPQEVNAFHERSDVDGNPNSQHHTLGTGHNQAASGDHTHNGMNSKRLMSGITVTGSRGGNAALTDLVNKLSAALGFTNGTTT